MAQEFYTLEEAAAKLGRSLDDVREMARNPREIRSFRDGSSFKFRKQDIDEMARKWSLLSDPDMSSGDSIHGDDANILSSDDMPVVIDEGALSGLGLGSSKKVSGPGSSGAFQPGSSRKGGPGSSSTGLGSGKGGPGSDLKLAFQDDDVHSGKIGAKPADSDVKLAFDDGSGLTGVLSQGATPRVTPDELEATAHIDVSALGPGSGKSGPGSGKRGLESTAAFDLGPGSGKDSGKNLAGSGKGGDDLDFNFDDDAGSGLKLASDKSDSDFDLAGFDTGAAEKAKGPAKHAGLDKAMDLDDSDTFALADEGPSSGPSSGINLKKPDDSGISLEDSSVDSSSEFELSVESTDSLPSFADSDEQIPVKKAGGKSNKNLTDSSEDLGSDFELALDEDDSEAESGSEVVALDEEEESEYDEAESDYDGYDDDAVPAAGAAMAGAGAGAMMMAEPAPWHPVLAVFLGLTLIPFALGGIMVIELMRNSFTYQEGAPITGALSEKVKDVVKPLSDAIYSK